MRTASIGRTTHTAECPRLARPSRPPDTATCTLPTCATSSSACSQAHSDPDAGMHRYFQATELGCKLACEWLLATEPTDPRLPAVRLQLCNWLGLDTGRLTSSGDTVGVGR